MVPFLFFSLRRNARKGVGAGFFTLVNLGGRREKIIVGPFIEGPTMAKDLFLTNKKSPRGDLASVFIKNQ
jgi:hypothetical protein